MPDPTFFDIPFNGNKLPDGTVKKLSDGQALENAFKLWLSYATGEKLRDKRGGWLVNNLNKQMTEDRGLSIKQSILDGLKTSFRPELRVVRISVVPDYQRRKWNITVVAYAPSLQIGFNTNLTINNEV